MKKVLLRAPLLTNSGYGVHSRQIFEWLNNKKDIDLTVECLNWGMTSWIIDRNAQDGLIGEIMSRSKKIEPPYDITFQVQLPDEWDTALGKKNIGITAGVETTICSPEWVNCCNRMDVVIVPSNFTKSVFETSGILTTDVKVIPEYFNHSLLESNNKEIDIGSISKFNFLMISQLTGQTSETDRKNILNTIKWFCQYFEGNENVGLLLKTNFGKNTKIDKLITKREIKNLIKHVRKSEFPKIYLIHGNMSSQEMSNLYKKENVNCLISATRGEGYGLPLVDAAAAGMPVLATNWSGHLDFLKNSFIKVDYDLIDIPDNKVDNRIFFKGAKWADPHEKSFKSGLEKVYKNYNHYKEISNNLKKETIESLHKEKIFLMYDNLIDN